MKPNSIIRFVGALACASTLLVSAANAIAETVVHAFAHRGGGVGPVAGLINVNGTLYGTTQDGGVSCGRSGCGTVFSINPSTGKWKVVHFFGGGTDGAYPYSGLIDVKGTLYGTTGYGGTGTGCNGNGCGTVFSVNPSTGVEKVVYSFGSGRDGAIPVAGLIPMNGMLFGTTAWGGGGCPGYGCGTVFSINPSTGKRKIVHAFANGTDGAFPDAGLINVNGTLYGTTEWGGTGTGCGGCGTVFSVNPSTGAENIVYSFAGGTDGAVPHATLINANGTLYGTTTEGGGTGCQGKGCGTVFSVNPSTRKEQMVHIFSAGNDGADPNADLISVNGTLYGTTTEGAGAGCQGNGCGTVFLAKR